MVMCLLDGYEVAMYDGLLQDGPHTFQTVLPPWSTWRCYFNNGNCLRPWVGSEPFFQSYSLGLQIVGGYIPCTDGNYRTRCSSDLFDLRLYLRSILVVVQYLAS